MPRPRLRHALAALAAALGLPACALIVGSVDGTRSFDGGAAADVHAGQRPDAASHPDANPPPRDAVRSDSSPPPTDAGRDGGGQGSDAGIDACAPGTCTPLLVVGSQPTITLLAVSQVDGAIYWLGTDLAIFAKPATGPVMALPSGNRVDNFVVDSNNVYWVSNAQGELGRAARDGSGPATALGTVSNGGEIAVDETYVYWTDDLSQGLLYRVPKNAEGGAPDSGVVLLESTPTAMTGLAIDSLNLYVIGYSQMFSLVRSDPSSKTNLPVPLLNVRFPLAGDPSGVTWYTFQSFNDAGALTRYTPSNSAQTLIAGSPYIVQAASDGVFVYWIEDPVAASADASAGAATGTLLRAPVGGGAAVVLVPGLLHPTAIALGQNAVFWAAEDPGGATSAIWSVPK